MTPLTVIFLWPLVMLVLFKRFSLPAALCWSIIAGYLLLPTSVGFNLPMLPAINKLSMPSIAAVLILMAITSRIQRVRVQNPEMAPVYVLPGWLPRNIIVLLLLLALIAGAFLTVLANGDRLNYGLRTISGLSIYDGFAAALTTIISVLPLLLARKYLATPEAHKTLLFILCIAGLIYSLPTLYEVRMSPQLNRIVYGFFPHSWAQHIRGAGFRPLVFLQHGLWLGIFLSGAVLATLAYIRIADPKRKGLFWGIAIWLFATLILAKSLGALMITIVLAPVVLFLTVRLQLIVAAVVAGAVLFYPTLRGADLIPVDRVVSFAASINDGRGRSLQYRLNNEDILLEKANERPLFGWGGHGRARVYDEKGKDISTTDGRWIISIGNEGWFGYLARFGLLTIPIILLAWRRKKYEVTLATSGLCLVLAGNLIDLIPNAGLTPVTWLMAGALLGRLEVRHSDIADVPEPVSGDTSRTPQYRRKKPAPESRPSPEHPEKAKPGFTRFPPLQRRSGTPDS